MEIQRINTYKDDRFPKEILLQHGAFVIDEHQICMFKIIDHYSAEIYFDQDMEILPVIKEFREYAEHMPNILRDFMIKITIKSSNIRPFPLNPCHLIRFSHRNFL